MDVLMAVLSKLPAAITAYTETEAFKLTQHDVKATGGYALQKLSASGMDLGSDSLFSTCAAESLHPRRRPRCSRTRQSSVSALSMLPR